MLSLFDCLPQLSFFPFSSSFYEYFLDGVSRLLQNVIIVEKVITTRVKNTELYKTIIVHKKTNLYFDQSNIKDGNVSVNIDV